METGPGAILQTGRNASEKRLEKGLVANSEARLAEKIAEQYSMSRVFRELQVQNLHDVFANPIYMDTVTPGEVPVI